MQPSCSGRGGAACTCAANGLHVEAVLPMASAEDPPSVTGPSTLCTVYTQASDKLSYLITYKTGLTRSHWCSPTLQAPR